MLEKENSQKKTFIRLPRKESSQYSKGRVEQVYSSSRVTLQYNLPLNKHNKYFELIGLYSYCSCRHVFRRLVDNLADSAVLAGADVPGEECLLWADD